MLTIVAEDFMQNCSKKFTSFLTLPARVSEITGVDFAGPLEYAIAKGEYGKGVTTKSVSSIETRHRVIAHLLP